MARLTIEQVAAPDFSSTSDILANAARSFDAGMESAKGLLGKYQEGQQTKNDSLILNDIAKLGSEDELNAYLASDALMGKNFSPKMQETILGLRKGVLGYGQDRANIDQTTSATSRANAAEGRTAAEYLDGVNARTERRGMTGAVVDATIEGRTNGNSTGETPSYLRYSNQSAKRNDPISDNLVSAMSFVGDMGLTMDVISGGQEDNKKNGTGSTRHNHGNSADVDFYDSTGRKLDWNNPADRPIFEEITARAVANGVTGIGAGDDYMGAGRMHVGYGNPGTWGANGSGANAPDWLKSAYARGQSGESTPSSVPVTKNPAMGGGSAADALASAVKESIYMEPEQALAFLQTGFDAQTAGQTAIDAAERKRIDEAIAAGTLDTIQDPNNLSGTDVQQDMLRLGGNIPAADLLTGATKAGDLAFGSLAGVVAPSTTVDPLVTSALTEAGKLEANEAAKDPTFAAMGAAEAFEASGDVAQALIENTGGLAEGSGLDKNYVETQIERIAKNSNVTTAQAAATLEDMIKAGIPLEDMLVGNDPDMDAAITKRANTLYSEEAMKVASDKRKELDKSEQGRASAELQLSTAQTRAAKLPEGSAEREAADAQIAVLKDTLLSGMTTTEVDQKFADYVRTSGMASRLQGLSPDDPDFTRAMMQLEEVIRVDKSLSDGEKKLLIGKLRG